MSRAAMASSPWKRCSTCLVLPRGKVSCLPPPSHLFLTLPPNSLSPNICFEAQGFLILRGCTKSLLEPGCIDELFRPGKPFQKPIRDIFVEPLAYKTPRLTNSAHSAYRARARITSCKPGNKYKIYLA